MGRENHPTTSSESLAGQQERAARGACTAKGGILMFCFKVGEIHENQRIQGKSPRGVGKQTGSIKSKGINDGARELEARGSGQKLALKQCQFLGR